MRPMSGEGNAPAGFLVAVLGFPAGIKAKQNLYNKLALKQHHYRRAKGREQTLYPKTYKQTFAPAIMLGLFFIPKAYNAQNFWEKQPQRLITPKILGKNNITIEITNKATVPQTLNTGQVGKSSLTSLKYVGG